MITSAVSRTAIVCADNELLRFTPSAGQTCEAYMATYISQAGGYLIDPASTASCEYCTLSTTDQFLEGAFGLKYNHAYVPGPMKRCVWLIYQLARLWYRLGVHRCQHNRRRILLLVLPSPQEIKGLGIAK